jgi:excisionase family DNA binding protein
MSLIELGIDKVAYSRKETAKKLSVGLSMVDQMIADGRLKSVKLGNHRTAKRLVLGRSIADVVLGAAATNQDD